MGSETSLEGLDRGVIETRSDLLAEVEIRMVFDQIAEIRIRHYHTFTST